MRERSFVGCQYAVHTRTEKLTCISRRRLPPSEQGAAADDDTGSSFPRHRTRRPGRRMQRQWQPTLAVWACVLKSVHQRSEPDVTRTIDRFGAPAWRVLDGRCRRVVSGNANAQATASLGMLPGYGRRRTGADGHLGATCGMPWCRSGFVFRNRFGKAVCASSAADCPPAIIGKWTRRRHRDRLRRCWRITAHFYDISSGVSAIARWPKTSSRTRSREWSRARNKRQRTKESCRGFTERCGTRPSISSGGGEQPTAHTKRSRANSKRTNWRLTGGAGCPMLKGHEFR